MPPRCQTHVNTRTSQIYRACVQRVILCACHYAPVRSICIQPCILCETMGVPTSRDWHVSTLKKGPRFLTFIHTGLPVSWSTLMTLHRASESQEESNDRKSRKPLFNRVPFRDGFRESCRCADDYTVQTMRHRNNVLCSTASTAARQEYPAGTGE